MANLTLSHSGNMDITSAYIADDQLFATYAPNNSGKITGWTYDEPAEYVCGGTYTIVGHPLFSGTVYTESFTVSGVDILGNAKSDMSVLRQDFDRNLLHRTVQKVRPNPIDGVLINSTAMTENTFEVNFTITGNTNSVFILMYYFSGETGVRESTFYVSRDYTVPPPPPVDATSLTLNVDSLITNSGIATTTYLPQNATVNLAYSSSDSTVATITNNGIITVKKSGTVTLCVRDLITGLIDCKTVDTLYTITGLTIIVPTVITDVGYARYNYYPSNVNPNDINIYYETEDDDVVEVYSNGKIKALQNGYATICVGDTVSGLRDCQRVRIVKTDSPDTGDTGSSASVINIIVSDTITDYGSASTYYYPSDAFVISHYSSSDETLATIDEYTGFITVLRTGSVQFTVYDEISHLSDSKTVSVVKTSNPDTGGTETRLIVHYNVTSTTEPTEIMQGEWSHLDLSDFIYAELENGTNVPIGSAYTFSSLGVQKIYYTLSGSNIPVGSFIHCDTIVKVEIPLSITSIGYISDDSSWSGPFEFCSNLYEIVLPNSLTSIGSDAFRYCTSLTGVTIPESVNFINATAFQGCYRMRGVYGKYTTDDHRCIVYNGTLISYAWSYGFNQLIEYTIPEGVTTIGAFVFNNQRDATHPPISALILTTLRLPQSLTRINEHTFGSASGLNDGPVLTLFFQSYYAPTSNGHNLVLSHIKSNGTYYYPTSSYGYGSYQGSSYGTLGYFGWSGIRI